MDLDRVATRLEKSWNLGMVREVGLKGEARENVFLHVVTYCEYCSWHKICKKGVLY